MLVRPPRQPRTDAPVPSNRDPIDAWLDVFIRVLGASSTESAQIRDELEDHLRSRVDDLMIAGRDQHDAVREAVNELGETTQLAVRFRKSRKAQHRRIIMHAVALLAAGTALAVSVTSLNASGSAPAPTPLPQAPIANPMTSAVQPEDIAPHDPLLHRYAVDSIVEPSGQVTEWTIDAGDRLLDTIRELVSPDDWVANGGDQAMLLINGSTLFVRGNEDIQGGVRWVIESLESQVQRERDVHESRVRELRIQMEEFAVVIADGAARKIILERRIESTEMEMHDIDAEGGDASNAESRYASLVAEHETLEMEINDARALRDGVLMNLIALDDEQARVQQRRQLEQQRAVLDQRRRARDAAGQGSR